MSQPEYLDEIRSSRLAASPELRERVRGLAATLPPAPPRRTGRRAIPWRRWSLVLVPACVALAGAGALVAGLATSGKKQGQAVAYGEEAHRQVAQPTRPVFSAADRAAPLSLAGKTAGGGSGAAGLPASARRAQLYEAELTLEVKDLSAATKSALRLTRGFHGYVQTIDYGSGGERGSARMVLRVPVGSVQEAIVRFSALGRIVDQHVSIRDVQPQLDKRFRAMQSLRDQISKLQARLENPSLTEPQRKALENELVAARRRLVVLQRAQAAQQRQASFATVSLALKTTDKGAAIPHEPGRIERALDRSGSILLDELKVAVYVLIVGAPLLALVGLALAGTRIRRRRIEARLLGTQY
jgi:uncharacterized protein DUF4349